MIARLLSAWRKAPWLQSAFALALALTLFFGGRFVADAVYWADPRHQDQPIAGWMTPGYIAMSWDIPRDVMLELLPRPEGQRGRNRLDEIAANRDVPLATLIDEIEAAIQSYRETQQ